VLAAFVHPGHRIELPPVPVLGVQRLDRAGVVQERSIVAQLGAEPELVRQIRPAVTVVVDVDLVEHVVAELEEGRPARRRLQRHVVGDQRDRVGLVGADERVQVGAVGDRVLADLRRFTVRRHEVMSFVRRVRGRDAVGRA
jgi:hypothetical protein